MPQQVSVALQLRTRITSPSPLQLYIKIRCEGLKIMFRMQEVPISILGQEARCQIWVLVLLPSVPPVLN
jgi:hypothetical protein